MIRHVLKILTWVVAFYVTIIIIAVVVILVGKLMGATR